MALLVVHFREGHCRDLPRALPERDLLREQGSPERGGVLSALGRQEVDFAPPALADDVAHPLFDKEFFL